MTDLVDDGAELPENKEDGDLKLIRRQVTGFR